jgi:glycosyltransferase involved in cell wall biosynthesis
MRVLSVIHGPAFGGAHNQARVLRRPLEERGIETLVVLPQEASNAAEILRKAGVEVLTRPLHRLRATINPKPNLALAAALRREVAGLGSLIREHRIDVVQSHGATNPHGALAARRAGVASLWQIFDTRAPMALRRLVMPMVVRLADASTVWGQELARVHPGLTDLGERLTVVYPPVEQDRFAPDSERRASARAELGVADGELLVGSVGVLNPQKGHEYTIKAAAMVRSQRPETRFRILGTSSPAHSAYETGLREEIRRSGLSDVLSIVDPGSRVDHLIQAFDIFLMTSVPRSEGMPTVILEAMSCAKPVIATDVGATAELVVRGETGVIVEACATEQIAAALLALCEDKALRTQLGKSGRHRAQEVFGLERLADLHADAYAIAVQHQRSL